MKERWFGVIPRGLVLASLSFESSMSVLKADDRPKFHASALHVSTKDDALGYTERGIHALEWPSRMECQTTESSAKIF